MAELRLWAREEEEVWQGSDGKRFADAQYSSVRQFANEYILGILQERNLTEAPIFARRWFAALIYYYVKRP